MKAVIIGGDAAGMSAASQIKRQKPEWEVIVFEKGDYISYAACGIPFYIEGLIPKRESLIELTPDEAINKRKIDLRLNHEAIKIVPERKELIVRNSSGEFVETYDKLMIATGSRPNTLEIDIGSFDNLFTVKDIPSGDRIKDFIELRSTKKIAIIGGGNISIELAEAIREHEIETILIHRRETLHKSYEPEISDIIIDKLMQKGVIVKLEYRFEGIKQDGNCLKVITDKEIVDADGVILSLGMIPNTEIAKDAGIELGVNNAIKVNEYSETSITDIYSSGDCATSNMINFNLELYSPLALKANKQGMSGGFNMTGKKEKFAGVLNTSIIKVFDLGIARTGLTLEDATTLGLDPVKLNLKSKDRAGYYPGSSEITSIVIISRKDRRVLGAQLAGKIESVKRIDVYSTIIHNNMTIDKVFNLDLAYAPPFSTVYDPVLLAARVGRKKV
ncbi:MAG: FAD-dependent oxidoreductase [Spirochaetota bacterium]|nr:FAD-dependent oxidoreductase [Spirochaetota bacterium]